MILEQIDAAWETAHQASRAASIALVSLIANAFILILAIAIPTDLQLYENILEAERLKNIQSAIIFDAMGTLDQIKALPFRMSYIDKQEFCNNKDFQERQFYASEMRSSARIIGRRIEKINGDMSHIDALSLELENEMSDAADDLGRLGLIYDNNDIRKPGRLSICVNILGALKADNQNVRTHLLGVYRAYMEPVRDPLFGVVVPGSRRKPLTIFLDGKEWDMRSFIESSF